VGEEMGSEAEIERDEMGSIYAHLLVPGVGVNGDEPIELRVQECVEAVESGEKGGVAPVEVRVALAHCGEKPVADEVPVETGVCVGDVLTPLQVMKLGIGQDLGFAYGEEWAQEARLGMQRGGTMAAGATQEIEDAGLLAVIPVVGRNECLSAH